MVVFRELALRFHPSDLEQLEAAALLAGYDVEEYARLALHLASKATLEAKAELNAGSTAAPPR